MKNIISILVISTTIGCHINLADAETAGGVISFSGRIVESPCQVNIQQPGTTQTGQVTVNACKAPYQIQTTAQGQAITQAVEPSTGKPLHFSVNLGGKQVQYAQVVVSYL